MRSLVTITGDSLTLRQIHTVCCHDAPVALSEDARRRVIRSRNTVDTLVENGEVVYGITTGFGKFSDVSITADECKTLQRNLIITHAVGAGEPFSRAVSRGRRMPMARNTSQINPEQSWPFLPPQL